MARCSSVAQSSFSRPLIPRSLHHHQSQFTDQCSDKKAIRRLTSAQEIFFGVITTTAVVKLFQSFLVQFREMMQFSESFSFWTHNKHLVTLGNLHDFQLHRKRSKLKKKFLVCQSPKGASPSASQKKMKTPKSLSMQKEKKTKKLLCFSSMHNDDSQASNARWSNKPSLVVHLVVDSSGLGLSAC